MFLAFLIHLEIDYYISVLKIRFKHLFSNLKEKNSTFKNDKCKNKRKLQPMWIVSGALYEFKYMKSCTKRIKLNL